MVVKELAGVRLSVDCAGTGEQTFIFVHGGFCDRHDWEAQVRALTPGFRVVTLDMPGHGESGLPVRASVAELAQSVGEIKASYGSRRSILVGHSLGVDVCLEVYRQSPAGIEGLILIEGGLVASGDPEAAVQAFRDRVRGVGFEAFMAAAFNQMFTPQTDPELRERVVARLSGLDLGFAQEIIASKIRWDASEAASVLAAVKVPMLLLQSTYYDDTYVRRSLEPGMTTPWTELVTRLAPATEVHLVPNVGHFPHIEAPEAVNQQIREFAERLSATGA
jgi:pimeloyl-ACP methyl ester carboxylesterase